MNTAHRYEENSVEISTGSSRRRVLDFPRNLNKFRNKTWQAKKQTSNVSGNSTVGTSSENVAPETLAAECSYKKLSMFNHNLKPIRMLRLEGSKSSRKKKESSPSRILNNQAGIQD